MSAFWIRSALLVGVVLSIASVASADQAAQREHVEDPFFGEALFHAYQDEFFEALSRLDSEIAQHYGVDERNLDSLYAHIDHAEFAVGDFELHYRMHQRAGRAIRAVLEGDVAESVRNDAAYRLAKIYFEKNQPAQALRVLAQIHGEVPDSIAKDVEFLRANVYMAIGRPAEAVPVLQGLEGAEGLEIFSAYNLGIALLRDGRAKDAIRQLERAGRTRSGDRANLAMRDKSNLVLGTLMFEGSEYGFAQQSLDRVRLAGPFSNQALLRAGWTRATVEDFEHALVPWGILAGREATDAAVQEAKLALPFAYSKLNVHGRAAVLYESAVQFFGEQLARVDASVRSIEEGEFLEALVREEIRQDKDWVIHLRSLPEAPETFYLIELMASHEFQSGLQNYLDLEDLRRKLLAWKTSLVAFEDMLEIRRRYYEPILPQIDPEFRKLDAQIRLRLEQRKSLERKLTQMLTSPAPELLATSAETEARIRLEEIEASLDRSTSPGREAIRSRIRRLRGVLVWDLETHYHERLTQAHAHLRDLNQHIDAMTAQYDSFVRTRQAATHSHVGYDGQIRRLKGNVEGALERLKVLMDQQGQMLSAVATAELKVRRERLETYQNQARFAFADSYDRAAKLQASRETD